VSTPLADGAPEVPAPLDASRLARVLAAAGMRVQPGPDGALLGRWGEVVIRLTVGEGPAGVLNVVGLLPEPLPVSARPRLRTAVEQRHRRHPWPTCFLTDAAEAPDGGLLLGGACAIGVGAGITDAQVLRHVRVSVLSFREAFAELRDAVGRPRPQGG